MACGYENGARALLSLLNYDCHADQGKFPSFHKVSLCPFWVLQRMVENPEAYKFGVFMLPLGQKCELMIYAKFVSLVAHGQKGSLMTITAKKFTGRASVAFGPAVLSAISPSNSPNGAETDNCSAALSGSPDPSKTGDSSATAALISGKADPTSLIGISGSIVIDAPDKGVNSANRSLPQAFALSGVIQKIPSPGDSTKQAFAFTDGSFKKNESGTPLGGYGFTLTVNGTEYTGGGPCDTESNNIDGEVQAILQAVKKAVSLGVPALTIFHDYEHLGNWAVYVSSTEKAGPKKIGARPERPIAKLLFQEIAELSASIRLTFIKVQGHAGIEGNNRADELADALSYS